MRQKLITLCPNTFEIAQKMPNFSKWVREQLSASVESEREQDRLTLEIPQILYESYCPQCDLHYRNHKEFLMEVHYCPKCFNKCEYKGAIE